MENLMEMEYVINGEKYLVTVTKVEEPTVETNNTDMVETELPNMGDIEFVEVEKDNLVQLSTSLMPAGMDLSTWLDIIKEYGVILTD